MLCSRAAGDDVDMEPGMALRHWCLGRRGKGAVFADHTTVLWQIDERTEAHHQPGVEAATRR